MTKVLVTIPEPLLAKLDAACAGKRGRSAEIVRRLEDSFDGGLGAVATPRSPTPPPLRTATTAAKPTKRTHIAPAGPAKRLKGFDPATREPLYG